MGNPAFSDFLARWKASIEEDNRKRIEEENDTVIIGAYAFKGLRIIERRDLSMIDSGVEISIPLEQAS